MFVLYEKVNKSDTDQAVTIEEKRAHGLIDDEEVFRHFYRLVARKVDYKKKLKWYRRISPIFWWVKHKHTRPLKKGEEKELIIRYKSASKIYEKIGRNDKAAQMETHLGIIFSLLGEYEKAIKYYLKAKKRYGIIGDDEQIANKDATIGDSFLKLGNNEEAIRYLMKAKMGYENLGKKFHVEIIQKKIQEIKSSKTNT
jgi:tetratricopeptide (TPR) repeat protein